MKAVLRFVRLATLLILLLAATTASAFYDPTVGKWISRDPIGEVGSHNLGAFVLNDPVNDYDEIGLKPKNQPPVIIIDLPQPPGNPSPAPVPNPRFPPDPSFPINNIPPFAGTPSPRWHETLPDCPCDIPVDKCGRPLRPFDPPFNWTSPALTGHIGAMWEIRFAPGALQHGQQCVYDACGKLINLGPGAGTPDYFAFDPDWRWQYWLGWGSHGAADYFPPVFLGPIGWWDDHEQRPPNQGRDRTTGKQCPKNDGSGCRHAIYNSPQ